MASNPILADVEIDGREVRINGQSYHTKVDTPFIVSPLGVDDMAYVTVTLIAGSLKVTHPADALVV